MSKYIDQDALCEFARHSTIGIDANDIMRFPSIEIIHCKDCKHREKYECGNITLGSTKCSVTDNWFCADGERKEAEK